MAMAIRYGATGCSMRNRQARVPATSCRASAQHLGAHHHGQRRPGATMRARPGLADAGAVLRGHPGAREDGLALAEQVGLLLAGGLRRRQPLQRLGVRRWCGSARRRDAPCPARFAAARPAPCRPRPAEGQRLALVVVDRLDGQARWCPASAVLPSAVGLHIQRGRARQRCAVEIRRQVQVHMRDARDGRLAHRNGCRARPRSAAPAPLPCSWPAELRAWIAADWLASQVAWRQRQAIAAWQGAEHSRQRQFFMA